MPGVGHNAHVKPAFQDVYLGAYDLTLLALVEP